MIVTGCDAWPEQKQSLIKFGEFIGANSINYEDHDKYEDYIITRGKRSFLIRTGADYYRSAFLNITEIKEGENDNN